MFETDEEDATRRQPGSRMGAGMFALAWVVFGGLLLFLFADIIDKQRNPNQSVATTLGEDGRREVVLLRNRYGHYVTDGFINGEPVVFLLDTGATGVAIPAAVARRLGLPRGRPYRVQTANGAATAYSTQVDSVRVGAIELRGLSAGISPGLQTNEVLLGMSFLRHIEFTQQGNQLVLRQ